MAYIVVTQVGREPCRHELTRRICIGRSSDCDVSVADQALSRRHCVIEPADESWREWAVEDLDSLNGTRVGPMYVNRRILQDGDEIVVGGLSVTFHAAGYVGRRPDRPEMLEQKDDACVNEDVLRAGPWPKPRLAEPRRLALPEWQETQVEETVSESQTATADEGTPAGRTHYGLVAGIAASAATLGAAAVWMLSH
jgi:pSer/pThr/pTyr-binding forkhead associated (FHA) protein